MSFLILQSLDLLVGQFDDPGESTVKDTEKRETAEKVHEPSFEEKVFNSISLLAQTLDSLDKKRSMT